MLYTQLLGKTLRRIPREFRSFGHGLLIRGGYIRTLGQGLYSFLPLGLKVMENLKKIIKEEMDLLGGQEIQIPLVNPYELWEKGGRLALVSRELVQFKDHKGKKLVLSPSHEEAMVELVRSSMHSYRDLPVFLYEFQQKFRDEDKVRCGLIRTKEFTMKDAYSFHRSFTDLNNFFPRIFAAYERIFKRCEVEILTAEAGVGIIGGEKSYEFLMPAPFGDDVVIVCDNCGYSANRDVALGKKEVESEMPEPIEVVATPDCTTMEELSDLLQLPKSKLVNSQMYKAGKEFIMAAVRADYDISVDKLSRFLGVPVSERASPGEIESLGLTPGYLSPVGTLENIKVVIDDTVTNSSNLVMGTNEEGYHYINANYGRDFESRYTADICKIRGDDFCRQCGHQMKEVPAVELGNIFKLGTFYTKGMNLSYTDDTGNKVYPHMGAYGIGLGRLMACIVEANHDLNGIRWPSEISPYKGSLIGIGKSFRVQRAVSEIHTEYSRELLLDDRAESVGVKFKDADLIGFPLRIVISPATLKQGMAEFRSRKNEETWLVPLDKLGEEMEHFLSTGKTGGIEQAAAR